MTVVCLRGEGFNVFRVQQTTGAVTGHAADTITDSSKAWTIDAWQNHAVRFTSGNHNTRSYSIISNTATELTCTIPKGPSVSGENIGTGDGTTTGFSGTLADPVDTGTLSITDTIETFTDQGDGTLAGNNGGSGTIDYDTGAWSVTFGTAPVSGQAITADYDPLYNFNNDGGLAAADTFEIIDQGGDAVENTTPPGSADLVDQAISTLLLVMDDRFYHCEDLVENTTPPGSEDLVDQDVSTIVVTEDEGFYLYLDTTDGATFAITALTGEDVTVSGAGWSTDEWIGSRIEFTDGSLSGQGFFISSNTSSDIYSAGVNLGAAGAQVGDHFNITHTFFALVMNATPPGSEDLVDQAISTLVVLVRDKFYHCVCSTDRVFTPASITHSSGGGNSNFPSISGIGYKVVFTGGPLSGNSYTVHGETGSQEISVHGSLADVSNPYIIVPYATEPGAPGAQAAVDQAVDTLMTNSGRFYLYLDPTGGAVFTITSLTGEGVTVSGAGWTDDDWVEYWIEFVCTDPGGLSGESFLISSNTNDTIYSEGINFAEAGAKVGDTFIIRGTFFILSEPPAMMPIGAIVVAAPPVYGPKHGRGIGLSVHPSARYGVFFTGGAAARGLK